MLTIGHSTRPLEEFLAILKAHGIDCLIDVRTVPRSRTNPQFNRDTLPGALGLAGIQYSHMPNLGGLRHARRDSVNTGWRNASFRGFADYMQAPGFETGIESLLRLARTSRTAIMCAEAVPWRCHRSLIADALVVRGIGVEHVTSAERRDPHRLTGFAHLQGTRVIYPGTDPRQGELPTGLSR